MEEEVRLKKRKKTGRKKEEEKGCYFLFTEIRMLLVPSFSLSRENQEFSFWHVKFEMDILDTKVG